ncbi:monooxygenase-like protein [Hypoxylon crocopeplum]|nr:monooxygenase-like protein [Hypoxylon crocopeplum]
MEKTEVVIVGAGPAGLALALSLAKLKVHSVILEKDLQITRDPRGVYLTHDAVRILWDLGLGDSLIGEIGYELITTNFHTTSFANKPFYTLDFGYDGYSQVLPNAVLHIQPKLEAAMQQKAVESSFCDLRCGCTVVGKEQDGEYPVIQYEDGKGVRRVIEGSFVIGADGKKGVVRKHFLEVSAGIKQVDNPQYHYDGTWVAANLKLTVPTPETHPDFPLWKLGFDPEAVYDLFWPRGWHFCCPPGKATAAGRFGPYEERLWRHEFAQNDWNDSMDAERLLWEHITPLITRKTDGSNRPFPSGEVTYPRSCIDILRCRPFRFTHKVVNKWFDGRTILIGDAAHVFPPFGGQGIASGLRDAHQLAWRISLLQRLPKPDAALRLNLLDAWAKERHQGVKDAATVTSINGRLCNQGDTYLFWLLRTLLRLIRYIPIIPSVPEFPMLSSETRGYRPVEGGFFMPEFGGGLRIAQIYVESKHQLPILSDELIRRTDTVFTLLVIGRGDYENMVAEAQAALKSVDLDQSVLSEKSIRIFLPDNLLTPSTSEVEAYFPTQTQHLIDLGIAVKSDYSASNYVQRIGSATRFVIVRPDFHVFSLAKNTQELVECLTSLRQRLR